MYHSLQSYILHSIVGIFSCLLHFPIYHQTNEVHLSMSQVRKRKVVTEVIPTKVHIKHEDWSLLMEKH